jgi:hypothetical protein
MIAIAISLLFGLAASLALLVVSLSVRSGLAAGMTLLANPERAGARTRQPEPASQRRAAIFPAERDRARAARCARPQRAAA